MKHRILLIHIGDLKNVGCCMMLQAVLMHINAEFYYHRSTYCRGYEAYGLKGSWNLSGYSIAISLAGDAFSLNGGYWQVIRMSVRFILMNILRQRYALFAQTFSNYGVLTPIVRYILRHATLITVRDEQSKSFLKSLGIQGHYTADLVWSIPPDDLPAMPMIPHSFHSRIWTLMKGKTFPYPMKHPSKNWKYAIFNDTININEERKKSLQNFVLLRAMI